MVKLKPVLLSLVYLCLSVHKESVYLSHRVVELVVACRGRRQQLLLLLFRHEVFHSSVSRLHVIIGGLQLKLLGVPQCLVE